MSRPAYPIIGWTNTGKVSDLVKLDSSQLIGFIVPATFVSTSVTFTMVPTLVTSGNPLFIPVADSSGSTISFTTTTLTAAYYGFSQDQIAKFTGVEVLKMNTGSNETQGIQIRLVIKPREY